MFRTPVLQQVGRLLGRARAKFLNRFHRKKGDVRRYDNAVVLEQRSRQIGRFRIEYVESSTGEFVSRERRPQSVVVDQSST